VPVAKLVARWRLYKRLEVIEEKLTFDTAPHPWYNETLCNVNNSVVRLGVVWELLIACGPGCRLTRIRSRRLGERAGHGANT
jgi:hypothetical protein